MSGPTYNDGMAYDPTTGLPTYDPITGLPTFCGDCVPDSASMTAVQSWVFSVTFTLDTCSPACTGVASGTHTLTWFDTTGAVYSFGNDPDDNPDTDDADVILRFENSGTYRCRWSLTIGDLGECWTGTWDYPSLDTALRSGSAIERDGGTCTGPDSIVVTFV